jgi:hypothetical protein
MNCDGSKLINLSQASTLHTRSSILTFAFRNEESIEKVPLSWFSLFWDIVRPTIVFLLCKVLCHGDGYEFEDLARFIEPSCIIHKGAAPISS